MTTARERELQAAVRRLERLFRDQQQEIRTLKTARRAPQLGHSSIESGALEVRDPESGQRMRIGIIDGRVGTTTEGGDPVDAPSAPSVTPSLGGLRVTWDGTLAGDVSIPVDFDHMAVHVSTTSGFQPSAATYVGSIRRAGEGGMLPVVPLPYVEHYVVLVPVTTGGVQGVASAEVAATPLQVDGADLTAGSVTAPIIAAGAVEADKLEAVLALVTTIIAGIPGAARVEMDQDGLRGYNEANELIFAIDATGNAVFSGDIVASEISGSRFALDAPSGASGDISESGGTIRALLTSAGGQTAQLAAAATQANFAVQAQTDPPGPSGGMLAQSDRVAMFAHSVSGDPAAPWLEQTAMAGQTRSRWSSGTSGSEVLVQALPDYSSILLTAPAATDPADAQSPGYIFTQRLSSDVAAVSMQSPVWSSGSGPERGLRSMFHVEGARPDRTYTRMAHSAARHLFQGQYKDTTASIDTADGVVEVASTHSILASRHAPVRSELTTQLTGFSTGQDWYDFPAATWAPFQFKTGWSGRVRVTVALAGLNNASDNSSMSLGFRLSGGSTVAASLKRCALIRSAGAGFGSSQQTTYTDTLNLVGNATYTVTPCYRITSGSVAWFDLALANHLVFEPLT